MPPKRSSPLTDVAIKNLKPKDKVYKKFDGDGLYIEVHPNGKKYWRMKYRFLGKEKRISLGLYPATSLKEARRQAFDAKDLLDKNIDPSAERRAKKKREIELLENSFAAIAHEWHETRYGMPTADQILFNRHYVLGYSYHFRQAKWALEIVDPDKTDVERADNFRPDYRIPEIFRADLADYSGSGFDRGHLVASANQRELEIQNSETFLLSNMTPQAPNFNRKVWKKLEEAIRALNDKRHILETYVISGPIFDFGKKVDTIGSEDDNGVTLPIPHEKN